MKSNELLEAAALAEDHCLHDITEFRLESEILLDLCTSDRVRTFQAFFFFRSDRLFFPAPSRGCP